MYKVDIKNKLLKELTPTSFSDQKLRERFDIQEWIEKTPDILGEDLLIIGKEVILPTGKRLDLLAIDKEAYLVVIELKRDSSGKDAEWQAIKYTSYCSSMHNDEIFGIYADYLGATLEEARDLIDEYIDYDLDELNEEQRIVLAAKEFHPELVSAVLWLREYEVDIKCVRLAPYIDDNADLFIKPEVLIPLPEAKDYIQKKEHKNKHIPATASLIYSLEESGFEHDELKEKVVGSLTRDTELTPRLITFFSILLESEKPISREEVKKGLFENNIGSDIGQSGRYLSNISQFITKRSNPHLRQIIEFTSSGKIGSKKDNYNIKPEYVEMVERILEHIEE
ncbi:MAG: DUF91 domain-containing protein [Sinobacterium sp.]|nr:DUF91 domain-containing protein [Sinobacterium sp.]